MFSQHKIPTSRSKRSEKMFRLVQEYSTTDESLKEFTARYSIPISSFRYWINKFDRANGEGSSDPAGFLPLQVQREEVQPSPADHAGGSAIRITYPDGTVLDFPGGVDAEFIKSLLPSFQNL